MYHLDGFITHSWLTCAGYLRKLKAARVCLADVRNQFAILGNSRHCLIGGRTEALCQLVEEDVVHALTEARGCNE